MWWNYYRVRKILTEWVPRMSRDVRDRGYGKNSEWLELFCFSKWQKLWFQSKWCFIFYKPNFTPENEKSWPSGKRESQYVFPAFRRNYFSILSKLKPPGRTGRCQFKIPPIPWLEQIPMEHLGEKSKQIHCKTEKNSFGVSE